MWVDPSGKQTANEWITQLHMLVRGAANNDWALIGRMSGQPPHPFCLDTPNRRTGFDWNRRSARPCPSRKTFKFGGFWDWYQMLILHRVITHLTRFSITKYKHTIGGWNIEHMFRGDGYHPLNDQIMRSIWGYPWSYFVLNCSIWGYP